MKKPTGDNFRDHLVKSITKANKPKINRGVLAIRFRDQNNIC